MNYYEIVSPQQKIPVFTTDDTYCRSLLQAKSLAQNVPSRKRMRVISELLLRYDLEPVVFHGSVAILDVIGYVKITRDTMISAILIASKFNEDAYKYVSDFVRGDKRIRELTLEEARVFKCIGNANIVNAYTIIMNTDMDDGVRVVAADLLESYVFDSLYASKAPCEAPQCVYPRPSRR